MIDAIGAGLIAGGAVALLPTLYTPPAPRLRMFDLEEPMRQLRRERSARLSAAVSVISTFVGASLLLVSRHEWIALAAGLGVIVADWLALAWSVARRYQDLVPQLELFVGRPKGLPEELAAAVGLATMTRGDARLPTAADPIVAVTIARSRSRFVRALRRPFGYPDGI